MTDRPILFSGPMIRALLEGRKTQTRRVIKPQPKLTPNHEPVRVEKRGVGSWVWMVHTDRPAYQFATGDWKAPYAVGDRLWVRETWKPIPKSRPGGYFVPGTPFYGLDTFYRADGNCPLWANGPWKPSIFMPRWASRLTLIVTDVRVQRLQDIREKDARAEGCYRQDEANPCAKPGVKGFYYTWQEINAKRDYGWEQNPWVVALTFDVIKQNIDQIEKEAA